MGLRVVVGIFAVLILLVAADAVRPATGDAWSATSDTLAGIGMLGLVGGFVLMAWKRIRRIAAYVTGGGFVLMLVAFAVTPADEMAEISRRAAARDAEAARAETAEAARERERERADRIRDATPQSAEVFVAVACVDPVERLAEYGVRWTDGVLEPKFPMWDWHTRTSAERIVTYYGDKVEFQNSFGAWQPHIYECDVDILNRQVLAARAIPGRL